MGGTEAVGSQQYVLQLHVQVGDGGVVFAEGSDGVNERGGQVGHNPMEFLVVLTTFWLIYAKN
jgi:hypothetical protein